MGLLRPVSSTSEATARGLSGLFGQFLRFVLGSELLQQTTDCVVFYGHGVDDALIEQGGESAAVDTTNDHLLRGTLVYAVACDAGRTLGSSAVNKGATAFVAYNDLFGTVKGRLLSFFRYAANAAILALLDQRQPPNHSCSSAMALAKREYDNAIDFWARGAGAGTHNSALAAAWLRWNRDSLILIGDPNATI
jgi:Peptidase family C25